jgi:hypothetical protein
VPLRARTAALAASALVLAVSLAACAADPWAHPREPVAAIGAAQSGFVPAQAPAPEATLTPAGGSWEGIRPADGYRVVLLTTDADTTGPTGAIAEAVRDWAAGSSVDLREVAADASDPVPGIVAAMDLGPELIICAGDALVDPLETVSANHLDEHFLVIGAELPEPTYNVTAVDWTGAGFRGESLGSSTHYDAASFTPERTADAVRAGVAAVLSDMTGVVLWID